MAEQTSPDLPAIAGGKPVKTTPYRKEKRYGDEELAQLKEALDQGTLFYAQGKKVKALEAAFAKLIGSKYAIACNSGTTAIHAALMAGGVSPGDEVVTAPITDMGSIVPILWQGAVPVFADLDPRTYNLTPETVEKVLTPKTKAVVAVHLTGNSVDLRGLKALCEKHGVLLVEDAAQAHGTLYDGKPVGTVGRMGCFSFNEFKHITCGDGGMVVTDDDALAAKLRLSTDKAYDRSPSATVRDPKFLANNYRMTELQGAVALAQLPKLKSIVDRRRAWCASLGDRLKALPGLMLPVPTHRCNPSWWFYMVRVVPKDLGANADEFAAALKKEGLPAAAHYIARPIYAYPLFADHSAFDHAPHPFAGTEYTKGQCPVAEQILDTCVVFSVNEAYSEQDLDETVRGFERVVNWFQSKRSART